MFRPHVASGMFVVGDSSFWRDQLQGLWGIRRDADAGANLSECWSSLVDLDVDVRMLEQGNGGA